MASPTELFIWDDGQIVPLSADYGRLAATYENWAGKGDQRDGRRLSIASLHKKYKVGEKFHVIHVLETISKNLDAYIMGPKDVFGEYLDGNLASKELPETDDPFAPVEYDGRVMRGPHRDFNFIHTTYKLSSPGSHEIVWKLGDLESNTLRIEIK